MKQHTQYAILTCVLSTIVAVSAFVLQAEHPFGLDPVTMEVGGIVAVFWLGFSACELLVCFTSGDAA